MAQKTGTSLSASPTLTLNFESACAGASELLAHMRKAISQLSTPGKFRHVFSDFPVSWLEDFAQHSMWSGSWSNTPGRLEITSTRNRAVPYLNRPGLCPHSGHLFFVY